MTTAVHTTTMPTPVGPLTLMVRDDVLVGCGWGDTRTTVERVAEGAPVHTHDDLGRFSAAVAAYFDGDVTAVDSLPVAQPGGAFRQAAWKVMREVPAGETISYAELAARAGSPSAVRAAGSACARNLVALVVPCHRIVRTGGNLGGYYYGLAAKEWLLTHERRSLTRG